MNREPTAVEVIRSIIAPGGNGGAELYTLDCEVEFVYVIRGAVTITLADEHHEIFAGDAMTFRGRDPHTWRNASVDEECEVLWVLSPAT